MLTRRRHTGKMSQLNGPKGDSFVRCQAYRKDKGLLPSGEGAIEWNPEAGTTGAPKMALALVLEQAEGRGLTRGKFLKGKKKN